MLTFLLFQDDVGALEQDAPTDAGQEAFDIVRKHNKKKFSNFNALINPWHTIFKVCTIKVASML